MATNKIITVTVIPTLAGDTIASYNAYSSIDGLLGAMTPAEGLAGKIFALSDGAIHDITVKAVWTTAGETTTVGSNVVVVDLSSIILFEDDFTGATIDTTTKWDLINPTSQIVFSQNNQLDIAVASGGSSNQLDGLFGQNIISGVKVVSFDFTNNDQANDGFAIGVGSGKLATYPSEYAWIQRTGATEVFLRTDEGSFTPYTLDLSTVKTIKIVFDGATADFYYWGGASWTFIGSKIYTHTVDLYPRISAFADINALDMIVDNFVVTNADFSTQRPV